MQSRFSGGASRSSCCEGTSLARLPSGPGAGLRSPPHGEHADQYLAHRYGDLEIGACNTELRISQTDLANMLGVSRQTVGKELVRLKDEGILGGNDRYRLITLLDIPGLMRIAKED